MGHGSLQHCTYSPNDFLPSLISCFRHTPPPFFRFSFLPSLIYILISIQDNGVILADPSFNTPPTNDASQQGTFPSLLPLRMGSPCGAAQAIGLGVRKASSLSCILTKNKFLQEDLLSPPSSKTKVRLITTAENQQHQIYLKLTFILIFCPLSNITSLNFHSRTEQHQQRSTSPSPPRHTATAAEIRASPSSWRRTRALARSPLHCRSPCLTERSIRMCIWVFVGSLVHQHILFVIKYLNSTWGREQKG